MCTAPRVESKGIRRTVQSPHGENHRIPSTHLASTPVRRIRVRDEHAMRLPVHIRPGIGSRSLPDRRARCDRSTAGHGYCIRHVECNLSCGYMESRTASHRVCHRYRAAIYRVDRRKHPTVGIRGGASFARRRFGEVRRIRCIRIGAFDLRIHHNPLIRYRCASRSTSMR